MLPIREFKAYNIKHSFTVSKETVRFIDPKPPQQLAIEKVNKTYAFSAWVFFLRKKIVLAESDHFLCFLCRVAREYIARSIKFHDYTRGNA